MVEIGHLLLGQSGLRVQIADVEGALNVGLTPGPALVMTRIVPRDAALLRGEAG